MASGRLGSAYVDAKRTSQVYANSSGGAVSLSIMAQAKSTTANVPLSIKVDNGSTAAETSTQIDSSSYNEQTLKLSYNSGITSVTGALAFSSYTVSGDKSITLTPPSGTATGTDATGYSMPMCTDSTFTSWKGYENNLYFPLFQNTANCRYVSVAQAQAAGDFNFISSQINKGFANFPANTVTGGLSYYDQGVVADPYSEKIPFFGYNNNNYITARYLDSTTTSTSVNYSTNSVFNQINGNFVGNSFQPQRYVFASGGMFGFSNYYGREVYLRYYGKTPTNDQIRQTVGPNIGSTGNANYYPLDIYIYNNSTPSAGYPNLVFLEYDPHQDKIYTLVNVGESSINRKLFEWQPTKLDTLLADTLTAQPYGTGSGGVYLGDDWERLINDGLVIDRTSNIPSGPMTANTCLMKAPLKRVQDKLWVMGINDPYGSSTDIVFYKTSDFLTYTEISSSEYYSELIDDNTTVLSNGTVTNKLVSNYSSLPDAGELEHQISVNNYERTGLVLSNNDKLYVRNHGDVGVAVSVMGYEE